MGKAEDIFTMQDLQRNVGAVVVADEAQPISPNGYRRGSANIPIAVQGGRCSLCVGSTRAVGYLQVFVAAVHLAKEA